ncbi:ATP-binding protein [Aquicoccus sp. G2-2]|uniref:ATP-binding protein n=1 Tax=Aquicoccus sp. G2-2 TaxID=3092120 RepID=UPI002ADFA055|nr:ATP-binding protein [Aquicoccus sp. G2-2]MEA1115282.1 ATP-binding protein [Aquicoccus sp. G2-2]
MAGTGPRLRWNDEYSAYFDACASSLATVIADAEVLAVERKRSEALAEIDRAKTAFFSNVSHEFRTPLTLMLGPLEDAMAEASRSGTNTGFSAQIETVYRNALRLKRLVNSLLDFSRIEAGRASAEFQPTKLVPLTTYLVSSFRSATEKAGLELLLDAHEPDGEVYLDRNMWENIILNLISNAFKFTLEGSITVEIGKGADGRSAVVTVRDTGVGIPEHELPRLFERFHRVEGVMGRSIEGSGIGLALVDELVRLHGGTMAVESEVGQGTAFTITIPLGKDHLPADQVGSPAEPATTGQRPSGFVAEALRWLPLDDTDEKVAQLVDDAPRDTMGTTDRHILVVDDNADMRDYLLHLLRGQGYHVRTAPDGLAALDIIASNPPDIVLCDLMMPRLDGLGLLARLREDEATRELPFIALSARAGEEAKIEGLNAGADAYLVKPFSSRELFARVASTIELARVRRTARDALKDESARLRRLFEQAPGFITTLQGPNHVFEFANASYCRLVGNRDIIGKSVEEALPEVKGQGFIDLLDQVYQTGKPYVADNMPARLQQSKDAPLRDVFLNFVYEPIMDAQDVVTGIFVEGHDVTQQHQTNEHLKLLVNELNHRVKNMLAIVQSFSRQTYKGTRSSAEERDAFEGRLLALAAAHDLLTTQNWETTALADIARGVFGIHDNKNVFTISGPMVHLNPKTAVTLAMAFHELTTNAIKYGALSVPEGSVELSWEVEQTLKPHLALLWSEKDGPKVETPGRRGFGSQLIERALAKELGGDVTLEFRPEGLVCKIGAPLPETPIT